MDFPKFAAHLVVLDTETTGLSPKEGHRIIEIGAIELMDRRVTGRRIHYYLNPDRDIGQGAFAVHGLSNDFLRDKPRFADIVNELLAFVNGAELVIHNAPFDLGFLDHELTLIGHKIQNLATMCKIFDTLAYARQKHPGQRNSLDALCKRYNVDNGHRDLHGALLDAQILVEVFLRMTGGQASLLDEQSEALAVDGANSERRPHFGQRTPLTVLQCSDEELAAHEKRLAEIVKASGGCLWKI